MDKPQDAYWLTESRCHSTTSQLQQNAKDTKWLC